MSFQAGGIAASPDRTCTCTETLSRLTLCRLSGRTAAALILYLCRPLQRRAAKAFQGVSRRSTRPQPGLSCLCHPTSDNLIYALRGCISLSACEIRRAHPGVLNPRVCRRVLLLISPHNHPTFLPKSQLASLPTSLCGHCPRAPTSTKTSTKTHHRRPSSLPGDTAPLTSFARRPSPRHRPGPTLATLATNSVTSTTRSVSSCRKTLRTSYSPESSADS